MTKTDPFKGFHSNPQIIRLAVTMYVRFPLSLRNVEDLLRGRSIEISNETVRFWWNRFGPLFAAAIRRKRAQKIRCLRKFAAVHASVCNQINQEHHLYSRDTY